VLLDQCTSALEKACKPEDIADAIVWLVEAQGW
jgi:hypothetical protein